MAGAVRAWGRHRWAGWALLRAGLPLQLAGPVATIVIVPVPWFTEAQRRRLQRHGVEVEPAGSFGPMRRALRTSAGWRQVGYHLLVAPLLAIATLALTAGAVGGLVLFTMPVWMWGVRSGPHDSVIVAGYAALLGLVVVLAALALVPALARADASVTRAVLGPSRSAALAQRLDELAGNRRALLEAADAERRRIERDLHDGAQQRLVALSVNLGLAEASLVDLPEPARQVIADARRQADAALADLTGLVRGLHPPILEDRGLVPALSSLAADQPLPVTVRADDIGRPTPSVESVAYFVVAEALTNTVKHAGASSAAIAVTRDADRLFVRVSDDGVGGTDPRRGTGLAGLARRVASVDGRFAVTSPRGGPTTIEAWLPCRP